MEVTLADLWLAVLLAAIFVFIASSVIHMFLPIHKSDCKKLPGEAEVMEAMRGQGVKPGDYMFPFCSSMKEMGAPEMIEKQNQGPVGFLTVFPNGPINMGKSLLQWFLYCILIGIFVAYLTAIGLNADASSMDVFRVSGTVAILGYGVGSITNSIWKGTAWSVTAKFIFDGVVYGLVTAATFGWLWPSPA